MEVFLLPKSIFKVDVYLVTLDQCAYNLVLPGASAGTFCRKRTSIASNMPRIVSLHRMCPGISKTHSHEHCWGSRSVTVGKRIKSVSLARAAGMFPFDLCNSIADIVYMSLSDAH